MKFGFYFKYLIISIFILSCSVKVQYNDLTFEEASKQIETILKNQTQMWNNGSIDGFMQGYWHSDSLKFITKRGVKFGFDSVALGYKKSYNTPEKMGKLTFKHLKYYALNTNNTLMQTTGTWHVVQKNETDSGMFSLFLKPINGQWKIIIDHTW